MQLQNTLVTPENSDFRSCDDALLLLDAVCDLFGTNSAGVAMSHLV
jgi:hypothetical protein